MATVHTQYGPGRIVASETVRGQRHFKVAGEGFEVWLDEAKIGGLRDDYVGDDERPQGWFHDEEPAGAPRLTADELMSGVQWGDEDPYGYHNDGPTPGRSDLYRDFSAGRHEAWAPVDEDNSTELPYNPDPQHDAIGSFNDDESSTIQPIHHIDADERLHSSDSLSFEDEGEDSGPGPNPDLFARSAGIADKLDPKAIGDMWMGQQLGQEGAEAINHLGDKIGEQFDVGPGWGGLVHGAGLQHEANPAALAIPLLRTLAPMAISGLMGGGGESAEGDTGEGWGDLSHEASYRPAGLSDRYIDIAASADYYNNPAAQFRHDPDAYINRIGHLMDEGLNPRFAEYMDLVEADGGIREAAWKDVRQKAMRLKTSGAVHVKDIAPGRIMASVDGDHGTYDVTILKGATFGGMHGNSISNWHCACEWGRWAFRRKFTFVGRLCSHAYASYLTMQSAAMKNEPRRPKRGPSDTVIVNRPSRDQYLPTFQYAAGLRHADALQDGVPKRLTPELVVNDTDDAQIFLDVTKDERKDTGPDDVMSDKDIVHFARLMVECERTEQPYPRQLVAFLARYAAEGDDTQADYQAADANDAKGALSTLRSDADQDQQGSFGNMADWVHRIQDAVEEARVNGADASRFVAMLRTADPLADLIGAGEYDSTTGRDKPGSPGLVYDPVTKRDRANLPLNDSGGKTPRSPSQRAINRTSLPSDGPDMPTDAASLAEGLYGVPASKPSTQAPQNQAPQSQAPKGQAPAQSQAPQGQSPQGQAPQGQSPATQVSQTPGGAAAPAPMTSGTIADGGVAGAENGNNAAITKNMLDADGNYTVGKGDTWSDIAQRTTGDMNNYQKMYDQNKGVAGDNIDSLAEGTKITLKDFANDAGNGGLSGDVTNPASGGADGNIGTVDTPKAPAASGAETGLNAGTSTGVDTSAAANPASATAAPPAGNAATDAVPPVAAPPSAAPAVPPATPPAPKPTAGDQASASRRTAKEWLRWAAEGDSSSSSDSGDSTSSSDTSESSAAPAAPAAASGSRGTITGPSLSGDTYNPAQSGPAATDISSPLSGLGGNTGGGMGDQISGIGNSIGGAVSGILPGLGGLISGGAEAIGGLMNTFSGAGAQPGAAAPAAPAAPASAPGGGRQASASIFASREDFDDWVRYAYPAGGGDDYDPKTLPHIPFAGSGNPGPLEFSTSEEYADKARKKHDDVTDLGDHDIHTDMGEWQKQGSYDEATDDGSDIVRSFQANMGGNFDSPAGGGRFDDFASAAQGFLRTAGRNYSLAEQDELIREGDKGGARNLASLDLAGTHYEDMTTLGW